MSNYLAIATVTAALYQILIGPVQTAVPGAAVRFRRPDRTSGQEGTPHLNVYLYQVTPNAAWRNVDLPSVGPDGSTRLQNPPLALDLHYLLTAYASKDTQAEALLGFAVLMMHENPVLPRSQISSALNDLASSNPPSNPLAKVLSSSGLADQIEMLKITPSTLGREEMAWIWTALKADYRPTFAFDVSVALLESPLASSSPLPVLSQNITAQPGSTAPSFQIQLPGGESAALPGDTVTLAGQFSTGTVQVLLVHQRLGAQPPITPSAATSGSVSFAIPGNTPAGNYTLSVTVTNGSGVVLQSTLGQPIALAPTIPSPSAATAAANASGTLVTLTANPQVVTGQTVSLAMGGTTAPAQPFTAPTATLSFQFPALAHGSYLARLRVDGVDSPVTVNWSATPPSFTAPFINV